jgi:hypothetical protein
MTYDHGRPDTPSYRYTTGTVVEPLKASTVSGLSTLQPRLPF